MSNEYSRRCQTRGLIRVVRCVAVRWSVVHAYILALAHPDLYMYGPQQLISLYTLRTLCFSRVMLQPDEEEKARKKSLHRSLVVVAFLWGAVILIVALNIDANGAYRFYGPTGYCKLCTQGGLKD